MGGAALSSKKERHFPDYPHQILIPNTKEAKLKQKRLGEYL